MSLTVLEEYIETGNHQDLDLLLSQNPDLVKENTSHDISPLLLACYYHKNQIIQVILKYIKSITIHEACAAGLTEQVQFMVDQKPDVINELSSHGFYPLGIAAHFGKEEIVRILLRNRANPKLLIPKWLPGIPYSFCTQQWTGQYRKNAHRSRCRSKCIAILKDKSPAPRCTTRECRPHYYPLGTWSQHSHQK
ncbi:Ankyrin repeats (3 copies) [Sphingobacterium daejeonense]|nr:Ankyrin repeats (3 copies) [Sphingobacterium daejeonense]